MKLPDETRSKSNFPPTTLSNDSTFPTEFYIHPHDMKFHRRRTWKPAINGDGIRLRKYYGTPKSKRNGLVTPYSKWKFDDEGDLSVAGNDALTIGRKCVRRGRSGESLEAVSARKLATGLWHLRFEVEFGGVKRGPFDRSRIKHASSFPFHKPAVEGATKWDTGCTRTSHETNCFYTHVKLHEDQHVATVSAISALQAELLKAQNRIHKLETERQSSKLKIKHFLRKLGEEMTLWRRKEHQNVHKIIGDLKKKLNTERNSHKRMQILKSKLVNELADVKLYAKQIGQVYMNERKSRKLTEEVCNELAKEIGQDKAEADALKRESVKIREEVEQERKMLQMAEGWREARVQLKLVDAKLNLEEKYSQMNKLITNVETFLRSRLVTLDVMEIREAEEILQAVNSLRIPDMNQFSYVSPKSNDIFSLIEELQNGESHNKETKSCITYMPDVKGFNKNPMKNHSNGFADHGSGLEESSSQDDHQSSTDSLKGIDPCININSRHTNVFGDKTKLVEDAGQDSPSSAISEICSSSSSKQSKQEAPDREIYKMHSVDCNGKFSNVSISNGDECSQNKPVGQCSFPDSGNPHIARAMKGCIEWPRGLQKHNLKSNLLEARVESQRIQLRHVLKQRN